MLIAEYILSQRQEKGLLHKNGAFVKTIVSTNMADSIAKEYNLKLIEVLTGFKFIGEQIKFFEQQGTYEYEFGFEESYGCLVGTHARDKDAIVAVMALCEAAAYYKNKGLTLWDQMINIYEKYGYYKEGQVAITMKGAEGAGKIAKMMDDLRNNTPSKIGNWFLKQEIIRRTNVSIWLQAISIAQDFLTLMYFIMIYQIMHGAVQDHLVQSLRLSSIWALRAAA